jgi:Ca2+-transporting ATPase
VNVVAVTIAFIGACAINDSPLRAVQMLWVNLIMDTFAALALATDPPAPSVLDRMPDRKSASLITLSMAKMIIGQAICQLVITLVLNFGGYSLLGYEGVQDGEIKLKTLVFNTFVWLQIFNEVNNRRLDNKLNIFEGIHRNYWFLGINFLMIGGQILIIFIGGEVFKITPLDGKEWGLSIGLGAISIPVGAAIRFIPDSWMLKILPAWIQRRWLPETLSQEEQDKLKELEAQKRADRDDSSTDDDFKKPPLRVMTSIRGERARKHSIWGDHRSLHQYVHDKKVKVHNKKKVVKANLSHDQNGSPDSAEPLRPKSEGAASAKAPAPATSTAPTTT